MIYAYCIILISTFKLSAAKLVLRFFCTLPHAKPSFVNFQAEFCDFGKEKRISGAKSLTVDSPGKCFAPNFVELF